MCRCFCFWASTIKGSANLNGCEDQLVQALPHGELETLDAAHLAVFHRADLTLPLMARFLSEISPRP